MKREFSAIPSCAHYHVVARSQQSTNMKREDREMLLAPFSHITVPVRNLGLIFVDKALFNQHIYTIEGTKSFAIQIAGSKKMLRTITLHIFASADVILNLHSNNGSSRSTTSKIMPILILAMMQKWAPVTSQ